MLCLHCLLYSKSSLLAAHVRGTECWHESTEDALKGVIKGWMYNEKRSSQQ